MKTGKMKGLLISLLILLLAGMFVAGCGEETSSDDDTGTVTGVVTDLNGRYVSGAEVTIDATSSSGDDDEYEATTDENGAFTIEDVPEGTWTMTVEATGYTDLSFSVEIDDGDNEIDESDTEMVPAGTSNLYGTITDSSSGSVLADVAVSIISTSSTSPYTATTDENGYYSITNVNSGQYDFTATLTGYNTSTSVVDLIEDINNVHNQTMSSSSE